MNQLLDEILNSIKTTVSRLKIGKIWCHHSPLTAHGTHMALQEEETLEIESISYELHEECGWVWEKILKERRKKGWQKPSGEQAVLERYETPL